MMKKITLTQGKFAVVDDEDFKYLNQWKWYYTKTGYAHRTQYIGIFDGKINKKVVCMHRLIMKTPYKMETDHINRNGLDNRKSNLRNVTKSQNGMNKKRRSDGSSKYKGVSWHKNRNKWRADIFINKKMKFLGYFDCETLAALAYNESALKNYKQYAYLNMVKS